MVGAAIQYYNNRGASAGTASGGYLPVVSSPIYGGSVATSLGLFDFISTGAINWTADASFKSGGMSANVAFVGAHYGTADSTGGGSAFAAPVTNESSYGLVVQGGYRFTDSLEAFGRWEWYNVAGGANNVDSLTGGDAVDVNNIITFGVNVYAGSNIKWSTQYGISLSDVGNSLVNLNGAGYQADANTQSANQMNIITQLQIMF
jgi:hypothetical protein